MKKILVVDDYPFVRRLLMTLLGQAGFICIEAEDGDVALDVVRLERVDCVVSDNDMPVMKGVELCEAMQNDPALRDIPRFLWSSTMTSALEERALRAGVRACFEKPRHKRLVDEIKKLFP